MNSRITICPLGKKKYIVCKIIIGCIGFLEMVSYCIGWVLSYYSEQPVGVTLTEYYFCRMNVIERCTFDLICFWVDLWFWCPLNILIVQNGPWDYPLNLQRTPTCLIWNKICISNWLYERMCCLTLSFPSATPNFLHSSCHESADLQ